MTRARDVADASLAHIKTETFSAATTVSINDVFSSDYDVYVLLLNLTAATNTVNLRLRVSGSDDSGSNYSYAYGESNNAGYTNRYAVNQTSLPFGTQTYTDFAMGKIEIMQPFTALPTKFLVNTHNRTVSTAVRRSNFGSGDHGLSTSYTGFSIISGSNITGTITVYGYRK